MYINNLKNLRTDKDMTQMEISNTFNINRSTYKNWENGVVMIPIEMADQFSVFYNVRISYILGLEKNGNLNYKVKKMNYSILLKNLCMFKESKKNTYDEIATYIGCTRSTCQRYFKGIVKIPVDRLILLAELYEIDLDKLCGKE